MSQEQPQRPQAQQEKPMKYGDVFPVQGQLADQKVAPQDASMMQTAEAKVLGQTQKGGAASTMQSAADRNERAGYVGHRDLTYVTGEEGVTVAEIDVPGTHVVTESVAGQVVEQYAKPTPQEMTEPVGTRVQQRSITIGEALEATARTAGHKAVDQSDAAAIQAAEARALGSSATPTGGVGATAQAAASLNDEVVLEEDKVMLTEVLADATMKLPLDKVATREDAEGVLTAELRNKPTVTTYPGGVAETVTTAARLNETI
ncbi:late embryogenesis abundant protein D-34-like [Malania oleifera]|uniref:late embryogenesis abundant protein D-34-like n=1 Tax=Malania oleifera TaxID=397392 RepID=UPI0025AE0241|nr:late embryogenesis abundant protein D-34-like [Malania oleifera]